MRIVIAGLALLVSIWLGYSIIGTGWTIGAILLWLAALCTFVASLLDDGPRYVARDVRTTREEG